LTHSLTRHTSRHLLLALALAAPFTLAAQQSAPAPNANSALPKGKQTTLGLYVTAREASNKWKANPDSVKILDVRTTEEFLYVGHAAMAWNVPLLLQSYAWDAARKRFPMNPNPDFLAQVKAIVTPAGTILITCRSGGRSAAAVNRLAAAGFKIVYTIIDGFEGETINEPGSPSHGLRLRNGWKNSGLPYTYDIAPERVTLPKSRQ
jgi:rhodanese-related sulfurtransferase